MLLLNLDERIQQRLIEDMISGGHARALIGNTENEMQYQAAVKIFDEKLSVRETEKLVKKMLEEKPEKPLNKREEEQNNVIYHEIEERLKSIIGSKVKINRKAGNKGRIEIEYYSSEELERIVELIHQIHE